MDLTDPEKRRQLVWEVLYGGPQRTTLLTKADFTRGAELYNGCSMVSLKTQIAETAERNKFGPGDDVEIYQGLRRSFGHKGVRQ